VTAIDQAAIVARVRSGEHCPIRWARVPWGRVVLHVGEDALSIGGVRQCVTATTAQQLADLLGCSLPTPEIVDTIHAAAAVRIRPCIQAPGPEMASAAAMERHSAAVGAQIAGRAGLASTVGKEWVLSSRLSPSVAANYGWPSTGAPNGRIWQTLGHRHNAQHVDYSQIFRPVARACLVDGAPADLHDVLRSRGLTILRQPGVAELEAVDVAPGPAADTIPAPPAVPFIGARRYHPGRSAAVRLVVLHTTEGDLRTGAARAVASWFAGPQSPEASAHYVVDAGEVVQGVHEQDTAWAAPGANNDGIQVEMVGRAGWTAARWGESDARAMVERAGALVGEICRRHGLPVEMLTTEDVLAGRSGVTTHAAVSRAFKRSTHWDPGPGFPLDRLIDVAVRSA
jgi:N-acetyl-anhydromuramyl-L-alanine amidase AmpD